nr:uncharacterized protein LOC126525751 [Dermacentor andersoni]
MEKMSRIILLGFCVFILPTNGLRSGTQLGRSTSAASRSRSSELRWLPGKTGRRCPLGQVYKKCASSVCGEYRCQDLYKFHQRVCTTDCQSRCFCVWPFFRNNDGRCVPVWQCYTYRRSSWSGNRQSSASGQAARGQSGNFGSASAPDHVSASSVPRSGNWGLASGAQYGSANIVNGQQLGGYGQVTGQPTASWVVGPAWQPGWGSMTGLQAGSGSYGNGALGVVIPQYQGSWVLDNGNLYRI